MSKIISIMSILHAGFSASRKSFRDIVAEFILHGVDVCQDKLNADIAARFDSKAAWNAHCKALWDVNDAGACFRKAKSLYTYAVEHGLPIVNESNEVILTTNAVTAHKKAATTPATPAAEVQPEASTEAQAEAEAEATPLEIATDAELALLSLIESGHEGLVVDMMNRLDAIISAATAKSGTDG